MTSKIEISNNDLKQTLGLSVSIIATEHFMSAGLSSPWSVAKFAISDKDRQDVWHYFNQAAWASLGFGALISWKLKSVWPVISSGATVLYYRKLYSDALSKTPTQNPTIVLDWTPLKKEEMNEIDNFFNSYDSQQQQLLFNNTNDTKFGYIRLDYD